MGDWHLQRSPLGHWIWINGQGRVFEPVTLVRAFPISCDLQHISVLDADGHELAWIDAVAQLSPLQAQAVQQALSEREFLPEVQALVSVSRLQTPCEWTVRTDRGETTFLLQGEEGLRRINRHALIISDANGVQYLIRQVDALDSASRRLLDRFL